ncbi:MAG TPA: helix-turn-helix transcriptional regulator [Steroidobacteraceae bacterium]|jgi:DNA-binding CsgD family transcriptional regulator|nr:helix-turn-helix transcriptional regulator [Steroidobacteraceae bacterium]
MVRNDEHWLSIIDAFSSAALGEQSWNRALEALAGATGSRSMQLACVDSKTSVVFNAMTNIDAASKRVYAESLPFNPRVRLIDEAPVLKVIADSDFITADAIRRDPFYQEVAVPWDIPWVCMTTLERNERTFTALAALRSRRDGHITSEQREIFTSLAPHVRAAVRTNLALEGQSVAALLAATESLSIPLFLCDRTGAVRNLTQAAAALITTGQGLQLKDGQLHASQAADAKALSDAIDEAVIGHVRPGPPILRTVIIRGQQQDVPPIVLDVFTLPARSRTFDALSFTPHALVVARGPRGDGARRAAILEAAYELTAAETHIALLLAEGKTVQAIAKNRGVAMGTVRAQIKTIFAKMGVNRQIELTVRLSQL